MTPLLRNIPHTPQEWNQWAFSHRDSHDRIRAAIKAKFGISLTDFLVDPINPEDFQNFLQNNSQLHGDMNSVLGLQSGDLQDVDLSKDNQKAAWIDFHFKEHFDAEAKLDI